MICRKCGKMMKWTGCERRKIKESKCEITNFFVCRNCNYEEIVIEKEIPKEGN